MCDGQRDGLAARPLPRPGRRSVVLHRETRRGVDVPERDWNSDADLAVLDAPEGDVELPRGDVLD